MGGIEDRANKEFSYDEMLQYLHNPDTRIRDLRVIESYSTWEKSLQVLGVDNVCYYTSSTEFDPKAKVTKIRRAVTALDLFRLYYNHSPRNNPAIHGLLDKEELNG